MSGVSQINVSYNPVEDRLLLKMNSQTPEGMAEYRLWLTRRFVQLMWQGLDKSMENESAADPFVEPAAREAVQQFKEEAALLSSDFSTPYKKEAVSATPLGTDPVLVTRMQIKKSVDGKKVLILSGEDGKGVTLALAEPMFFSIRRLLADSAKKAGWGLSLKLMANQQTVGIEHPGTEN